MGSIFRMDSIRIGRRPVAKGLMEGWALVILAGMAGMAAPGQDYTFLGEAPEQFSLAFDRPEGDLRLAFHYQDPAHHYALILSQGKARFVKVSAGREQALGPGGPLPPVGTPLTLQRRAWKMALVAPTEVIARAYDNEWTQGSVGIHSAADWDPEEWGIQPVEEIWLEDDFMRTGETGEWEPLSGNWRPSGLEGIRWDPRLSANPFSYYASGEEPGLSVVGYWFWDSYEITAAVHPEGPGAVGIVAYLQDPSNYLLFRWTACQRGDPGKAELVRRVAGESTVVAQTEGGYLSKQWYQLSLRLSGDSAQALIDGRMVMQAPGLGFSQGRPGLYVENPAQAHFDDVVIRSWTGFTDDFTGDESGPWTAPGWTVQAGAMRPLRPDPALAWIGPPARGNGTWSAQVHTGAGQAGLALGGPDEDSYYLFRVGTESAALVQVTRTQEMVLAESSPGLPQGQGQMALRWDSGHLAASLENQPVLETLVSPLPSSRLGIYARGPGVRFERVESAPLPPEVSTPKIPAQFTRENTMSNWAQAQGAWDLGPDNTYWHKGLFLHDPFLELSLTRNNPTQGSLALCLGAPETRLNSGYELLVAGDGQGQLLARLARAGVEVVRGQTPFASGPGRAALRFAQQGSFLVASLDGVPFLTYQDPTPLRGRRVGLQAQGAQVDFQAVQAGCRNYRDYTFSQAPVDWYVGRGPWHITERWKCSPQWSWFGCDKRRDAANVLWSKASFTGDVLAELYACIQMDQQNNYSRPSDLNVTLCGDGRDLSSGYSFIFGGEGNTVTRLLRQEQIVAQTDQVLLPVKHRREQNWTQAFHRHWFYLRVLKQGNRLSLSVDGREALTWEDPEPLPGGKIAFWTWNNGVLISRARIWYEGLDAPQNLPVPPETPMPPLPSPQVPVITSLTHPTVQNDFEIDSRTWASAGLQSAQLALDEVNPKGGQRSLALTNNSSGGDFGVFILRKDRLQPEKVSRLEFDYKVPATVKVNFYVKTRGAWHEITFTDDQEPRGQKTWLGRIPNVQADNAWHHAEFDLLGALQRIYGSRILQPITDMALASRRARTYLRCGFGGNYWGTTYHLDNFWWGGPGVETVEFTWAPPREEITYTAYRCSLDQNPTTEPGPDQEQTEPQARFPNLEPGVWYFHLRAQTAAGEWLPTLHHRIVVGERS